MYSKLVQQIVDTLEENLLAEWQLEQYANKIGYSKFYVTRQFKQETGVSIGAYLRRRRLAVAAYLLLHSDEPLLHISLTCRFQSQEAFTRAFKSLYQLPPGKYRSLMQTIHHKEDKTMTNHVKGWLLTGSHPESYTIKVDDEIFHTGTKSGYLGSTTAGVGQFGTLMQSFLATDWLGKRIKLSCYIKTNNATRCGAWCRIDDKDDAVLQFDNMDNRPITGTTDWNYYTIVLDVPMDAASIHFGVLLIGSGEVWLDGVQFIEVDRNVPTTHLLTELAKLPITPSNLDFNDN